MHIWELEVGTFAVTMIGIYQTQFMFPLITLEDHIVLCIHGAI